MQITTCLLQLQGAAFQIICRAGTANSRSVLPLAMIAARSCDAFHAFVADKPQRLQMGKIPLQHTTSRQRAR